jgi:hypothetical protein
LVTCVPTTTVFLTTGNANQMWNGRFYTLQTKYDNSQLGCVQVGP